MKTDGSTDLDVPVLIRMTLPKSAPEADLDESVRIDPDDVAWFERAGVPIEESGSIPHVPRWARRIDAAISGGPLDRVALGVAAGSEEARLALLAVVSCAVGFADDDVRAYLISIGAIEANSDPNRGVER